jgi:hypothetical protein
LPLAAREFCRRRQTPLPNTSTIAVFGGVRLACRAAMATSHLVPALALTAFVTACSSEPLDVCSAAADVIEQCTGAAPTTWGECTGETRDNAEMIAELDCAGLAAAQQAGKADGTCLRFFFFSIGDCDKSVSSGMANLELLQQVRSRFPPPGEYRATFTDEVYESHGVAFTCGIIVSETPGITSGHPTSADKYTVEVRSDAAVDDVRRSTTSVSASSSSVCPMNSR